MGTQAQAADRGTIRDDVRRPSMIVLEVPESSKREVYKQVAAWHKRRAAIVLCVEVQERPPMR